ncbi:hypothetical protein CMI47_18350 [Candidatus Pacearchaeota archaeon]|jgi:hypothetical protein|nr:hypothetical protein [Candidatus Pacearchaeota archaeon]|tara:strand:- start:4262 stop:4750 length:489 start_codon:yes stop_codon:yes gene_type:complete
MKHIYTNKYKTASEDPFTTDERSFARMEDLKGKAIGVSRAVAKPVKEVGKGFWNLLNYMGRGYAPFDVKDIVTRQFSDQGPPSLSDKMTQFKRIIKDNENKTPEEIEEISNIKERDLLLRLTSDDLEERLKIIERLKKELEINDKEIFKIVQKLIENARKKE